MMKFKRVLILAGLLLAVCAMPSVAADDPEVRQILHALEGKMQQIETMQARFTQTKKLSLFKHEMQLRGSVAMQKPDRFAWRTEAPLRYSIVFEKDKIYQWNEDAGQIEILSFSDAPVLRVVIEQMRTWFSGAYLALLDQYEIRIVSREPLTLAFAPQEKAMAYGMIQTVTIQFQPDQSYIESIRIEEKNGDRSVLNFTGTVLNEKIDPAIWEVEKNAL